jgi:hypothetical protein
MSKIINIELHVKAEYQCPCCNQFWEVYATTPVEWLDESESPLQDVRDAIEDTVAASWRKGCCSFCNDKGLADDYLKNLHETLHE